MGVGRGAGLAAAGRGDPPDDDAADAGRSCWRWGSRVSVHLVRWVVGGVKMAGGSVWVLSGRGRDDFFYDFQVSFGYVRMCMRVDRGQRLPRPGESAPEKRIFAYTCNVPDVADRETHRSRADHVSR